MPMLTTLRMRLPVWPVHAPRAHPVGEVGHAVEHRVHLGHDVDAVDHDALRPRGARSATCSTARSSVTLMLLAAEHRVDAARAGRSSLGQRDEQAAASRR